MSFLSVKEFGAPMVKAVRIASALPKQDLRRAMLEVIERGEGPEIVDRLERIRRHPDVAKGKAVIRGTDIVILHQVSKVEWMLRRLLHEAGLEEMSLPAPLALSDEVKARQLELNQEGPRQEVRRALLRTDNPFDLSNQPAGYSMLEVAQALNVASLQETELKPRHLNLTLELLFGEHFSLLALSAKNRILLDWLRDQPLEIRLSYPLYSRLVVGSPEAIPIDSRTSVRFNDIFEPQKTVSLYVLAKCLGVVELGSYLLNNLQKRRVRETLWGGRAYARPAHLIKDLCNKVKSGERTQGGMVILQELGCRAVPVAFDMLDGIEEVGSVRLNPEFLSRFRTGLTYLRGTLDPLELVIRILESARKADRAESVDVILEIIGAENLKAAQQILGDLKIYAEKILSPEKRLEFSGKIALLEHELESNQTIETKQDIQTHWLKAQRDARRARPQTKEPNSAIAAE